MALLKAYKMITRTSKIINLAFRTQQNLIWLIRNHRSLIRLTWAHKVLSEGIRAANAVIYNRGTILQTSGSAGVEAAKNNLVSNL